MAPPAKADTPLAKACALCAAPSITVRGTVRTKFLRGIVRAQPCQMTQRSPRLLQDEPGDHSSCGDDVCPVSGFRCGTSKIFCTSEGSKSATRRSGSGGTGLVRCSPPMASENTLLNYHHLKSISYAPEKVRRWPGSIRHLPLRNRSPDPAVGGISRCFRGLCGGASTNTPVK